MPSSKRQKCSYSDEEEVAAAAVLRKTKTAVMRARKAQLKTNRLLNEYGDIVKNVCNRVFADSKVRGVIQRVKRAEKLLRRRSRPTSRIAHRVNKQFKTTLLKLDANSKEKSCNVTPELDVKVAGSNLISSQGSLAREFSMATASVRRSLQSVALFSLSEQASLIAKLHACILTRQMLVFAACVTMWDETGQKLRAFLNQKKEEPTIHDTPEPQQMSAIVPIVEGQSAFVPLSQLVKAKPVHTKATSDLCVVDMAFQWLEAPSPGKSDAERLHSFSLVLPTFVLASTSAKCLWGILR